MDARVLDYSKKGDFIIKNSSLIINELHQMGKNK